SIQRSRSLNNEQGDYLRKLARKTWAYFETFVVKEDNWLPPDNYQEQPERIAHRTSPTNIGMALLANLTALDFGYLGMSELLERTNNTINTTYALKNIAVIYTTGTIHKPWRHCIRGIFQQLIVAILSATLSHYGKAY